MSRDAASERQVQAARPDMSTWLSANAGSGKTRVLTDRVARLLLQDVRPEHILCLTYTKAAATEMQNRLFRRLGEWAMLGDDRLRANLRELGVDPGRLTDGFLGHARTLFARAIETPGGLRIQTIHSFCAALLRRFPLEARVSPQFREMEDRAAEILRADILDRMASGPEAGLVADLARALGSDTPEALLSQIVRKRDALAAAPDPQRIRTAYGLAHDADIDGLLTQVFEDGDLSFLAGLVPVLEAGSVNDRKFAGRLRRVTSVSLDALERLEEAALVKTGDRAGQVSSQMVTKALRSGPLAGAMPRLEALMQRVADAREIRLALAAAERDIVLYRFAARFLPAYEAEKQRRGWLDFDDLIVRTRDLLTDPAVAEWVLYRLDGGLDHILVDEAQDTSPDQWQVIERLAREFTSGEGARGEVQRTIFVVGDKKQSIYSFQGADPREFDRMRADFAARLEFSDTPLGALTLEYSFRSAEPILRLVDNTFRDRAGSGFDQDQQHRAFRDAMPGRVDLWPLVEPAAKDDDGHWFDPVDRVSDRHHSVTLANRIARFIKTSIESGARLPGHGQGPEAVPDRPIEAGDFLILVRGRSRLFSEIIRACKQHGLPVAGADRLKVMAELAVRDLGALLAFLATPEDDLSLAAALRSPLFGVSEQQLFDLAHRRGDRYLWQALKAREDAFPAVLATLRDLRNNTDFLRPYDLLERILIRHQGRRRLIGRLGDEAEDGINALLGQALAYESGTVPSLTGFLQWMQTDDLTIKRAPDAAGARLRVMTVHGAKGLEAPIVILPDCARPDTNLRDDLFADDRGLIWKQPVPQQPARHRAALEAAAEAESRERDRLLYVALTRAEKWLVVAAAGALGNSGEAWYDQVRAGMALSGAVPHAFDFGSHGGGEGLRLNGADWPTDGTPKPLVTRQAESGLPDHLARRAPDAPDRPEPVSPSNLGGAKALPGAEGDNEDIATRRGTIVHALLETLAAIPPSARPSAAPRVFDRIGLWPDDADALIAEALSVLSMPDLAPFFAGSTLAEVPISAEIPGLGRIHGVIDRLIVERARVTAVDFKTNRAVPARPEDTPEGLLRQMGAYAAALAQVYPDREIRTGLIWTHAPRYMPLPDALITQSLGRETTS